MIEPTPMTGNEKRLWDKIIECAEFPYIRDIIKRLGIDDAEAEEILERWEDEGKYEYGVNIFAGWVVT